MDTDFLDPKLRLRTLDNALARRAIVNALKAAALHFHGTLLDIGCGRMPYKPLLVGPHSRVRSYIGLDIAGCPFKPDVVWDGHVMPFEDASIDCAIATEVFEHCPNAERVMCEAARVLKLGGILFFSVPFLWPLHCVPNDQYRYTPFALERHLRCAGFGRVDLSANGGWDASLAQMIGLWVRRRPMHPTVRWVVSILGRPLIAVLAHSDNARGVLGQDAMITGMTGMAFKLALPELAQQEPRRP